MKNRTTEHNGYFRLWRKNEMRRPQGQRRKTDDGTDAHPPGGMALEDLPDKGTCPRALRRTRAIQLDTNWG